MGGVRAELAHLPERCLQAGDHVVEGRRQPADLIRRRRDRETLGQVPGREALGRLGNGLYGPQRAVREKPSPAQRGRQGDRDRDEQDQHQPVEHLLDRLQGRANLHDIDQRAVLSDRNRKQPEH